MGTRERDSITSLSLSITPIRGLSTAARVYSIYRIPLHIRGVSMARGKRKVEVTEEEEEVMEEGEEVVKGKGKKRKKTIAVQEDDSNENLPSNNGEEEEVEVKVKGKTTKERSSIPREKIERVKVDDGTHAITIISSNAAGLRAVLNSSFKKSALMKLVTSQQPDILCIQEHKLQESHVEEVKGTMEEILAGYDQYWTCSTMKKGYSGVACFVRSGGSEKGKQKKIADMFSKKKEKVEGAESKGLKVVAVSYGLGVAHEGDDIASKEGRVITLETDSFFLVNTYVPNSGQDLVRIDYRVNQWDVAFGDYLSSLEKRGKPVILVGDLNVAHRAQDMHNFYSRPDFPLIPAEEEFYKGEAKGLLKQAGCTPRERKSFDRLLERGFVDSFTHLYPAALGCFTYWSQRTNNRPFNKGLRLDYFIVSKSMMENKEGGGPQVIDSYLLQDEDEIPAFSDHCPIGLKLKL